MDDLLTTSDAASASRSRANAVGFFNGVLER